jgi:hypothetical protein
MRRCLVLYIGAVFAVLVLSACGGGTRLELIPVCRAQQLHLSPSFYGEAGGQFIQTFTFTNLSRSACRLPGWPTIRVRGKSGPVSVRSRRVVQRAPSAPSFRTVALHPHDAASFDVYGPDWNSLANRPCPYTTAITVTPPSAADKLSAAVRMPICGQFDVAPVIAGKADRQSWSAVWHK